jgi:hypothetical protein
LKSITAEDVRTLVHRKRDGGHTQFALKLRGAIKRMFDYATSADLLQRACAKKAGIKMQQKRL